MPDKQETEPDVTVLCEGCGTVIELKDIRALVLGMHLAYNCPSTEKLREP